MKRIFSIGLLTVFLFSTIGVIASSVTCNMKEMKEKNCCSSKAKDCCEKEVKLLKLDDVFVSVQNQKVIKPVEFTFLSLAPASFECFHPVTATIKMGRQPAPSLYPPDRLAFIQSFLI